MVGNQQLTPEMADYQFQENGTHFSVILPYTAKDTTFELITSDSLRAHVDFFLLHTRNEWVLADLLLSCNFPLTTTKCYPNGTMVATAVKVESVTNMIPSRLTLKDQSCKPTFSGDRFAYFSFNVAANPRLYEPTAEIGSGQLMVQMRLSQDSSYALFYQAADYPVVKYLRQPLYFEVALVESTDPNLELILESCWATLDEDRASLPSWDIIVDGCENPDDSYVTIFHPVFFDHYMLYENEIALPYNKGASPVGPQYRQTISCYYVVNETQTVGFSANPRLYEPTTEIGSGQLMVQMRLSQDSSYALFYQAADYPVVKYLRQPLYFEVELVESTDPNLELILESCWATLDEDRTSLPSWDIIVDSCENPDDSYVTIFHPVVSDARVLVPSHIKRFSMKMFTFTKDEEVLNNEIFVHCDAEICDSHSQADGSCRGQCVQHAHQMNYSQQGKRVIMKVAETLLALSLLHVCSSVPISRPTNWLRQCRASSNLSITALEVLPGGGWDNLRNMDAGRVMNLSYFQCQTTEDGLYLIPDEVFVVTHKETGIEMNSEIISSWLEQRSLTSHSINAEVSFSSVLNGKFSTENQRMKTHQVKDSSTTARVQVRNFIYTVKAFPDFTLDTRFSQQVKEIADAIENNQTRNVVYLSEKMVLDYGTHVITSVDAGATLFLSDGQVICVGKDYEIGSRYSVPFGGLFSCQSNNPLANNHRRCPPKFSQHLAAVSDGCEVLYCVQSGLFTGGQLLPIRLPPFIKPPLVSMHATNTVMVMTDGDMSWIRVGKTKAWKLAKPEEIKAMVEKLNPESSHMSGGEKAGLAFGLIGMMALVVIVAVVVVKRRRRKLSGFRTAGSYEEIHDEVECNEQDASSE
ncbi:Macrophage-expressed gene 1 protein [Liparis tanakae]|uniref:Macrophage-expressed gene 1 protein n=1 Tax=Liparis tanakae TaxID=230148 RepID=A0A4Z2HAH3_9TELE|nr:Macrophage-expressed gene 1 protein [Liparis tanakae]